MRSVVYERILQYAIEESQTLSPILLELKKNTSRIIEVNGVSGAGKSFLYDALQHSLKARNISYERYTPRTFDFNQFEDIVKLVANIDEKYFQSLLAESKEHKLNSKYDFFYFITEKISKDKLFKENIVLVDNCDLLDKYSQDFLQYIVEYTKKDNIRFVCFTGNETFPFSVKFKVELLNQGEIQHLLQFIYKKNENALAKEAEILFSITKGNLAVIESIIQHFADGKKLNKLDLSQFLDRRMTSASSLVRLRIKNLEAKQRELLLYIYLLDGNANAESLNQLMPDYNKFATSLEDFNYVYKSESGNYYARRKSITSEFFNQQSSKEKSKYLNKVYSIIGKSSVSNIIKCKYLYLMCKCEEADYNNLIDFLESINDHITLKEIYEHLLQNTKKTAKEIELLLKLGKIQRILQDLESAADSFRRALRTCTQHNLSADEAVYCLAEALFSINSPTFALEIIKKFSFAKSKAYWKCKIKILQADILVDLEEYDEATELIEKVLEFSSEIEDRNDKSHVRADARKTYGKIFYSKDEWEKSENEFLQAEKLYSKIKNYEGLAAVYNNIGVLAIFQSDWSKAETLYKKSLKLEQSRYSLNGISVSYNNLGYLTEEKGDYNGSLAYFTQALQIQKLLSNRMNVTNIYANIGVTYMDNSEYEKAADALEKSLETAINFNLYRNIIAALNNLGILYYRWGDWNKAVDYYERAIAKSEENHFLEGLLRSYNNLGEIYEKKSEYNIAYDLYRKGLEFFSEISDEYTKNEVRGNLGSVLTHMHKFGDAYPYLIESFDYFKSLHAKDKIVEGALALAFFFTRKRNYESAVYYLSQGISTAKEINNLVDVGKAYLIQAELDQKDIEKAKESLEKAIELFVETNENFELANANYHYAQILYQQQHWEQALEILHNNRKVIKQFGAISLLEKNDLLIKKISKEYEVELNEAKNQESLLNKFYAITKQLNLIADFEVLLDSAIEQVIELSEADGGMLCLYQNRNQPQAWEYKVYKNIHDYEHESDSLLDIVDKTFAHKTAYNFKQPHFAPLFNNIISFPLTIRNNTIGVLLLFSKTGSHYFTEKMVNLISALCNQLVVIIENIRHNNLAKSHASIREELSEGGNFTNIVGKSKKMMEIFEVVNKIKDAPTSILLEGGSGTGKELIARAIHYTSRRRNKPFVAQYCGALPETLLESELFGHVKGAFTGAAYDKKGLFEVADGGTFFLDEIADISLSTQAKLLRFLQEGEVKRVGSTQTQKVDVRVVCATNVSLAEKVKSGEFRLDLYYRLNVIRIDVPSLKDRRSDIPLLAIHFLDAYNRKMNKKIQGITDEAMKYLMNCNWPGNIRQLENEIERAVTLVEDESFIKPSDLSEEVFKFDEQSQTVELLNKLSLKEAVEELEVKMIRNALAKFAGNQTQASADLGLSRQGLIKKIKRYNLEKE